MAHPTLPPAGPTAGLRPCPNTLHFRAWRRSAFPTAASVLFGEEGIPLRVVPIRCWRWDCPGCGAGRRRELYRLVRDGLRVAQQTHPTQPARFLTITYPDTRDLRLGSAADVKAAALDLREFIRDVRRHHGDLQYARVLEPTGRGRLHHHLVTWGPRPLPKCSDRGRQARGLPTGTGSGSPCYCPQARPCIQALAWRRGMGWVKVQAIRGHHRAAAYVAKYVAKGAGRRWPRYSRRATWSRSFAEATMGSLRREFIAAMQARHQDDDRPSLAADFYTGPLLPARAPPDVDLATGEVLTAPRSAAT